MPKQTERAVVRTYVPEYQKQRWQTAAEELDMSQSEFVRTMVQAGRREFSIPARDPANEAPENPAQTDATPGVEGLKSRILDALEDSPRSWDELVAELAEDLEQRVDESLQELQEAGSVRYSGRDGGYVLTDE